MKEKTTHPKRVMMTSTWMNDLVYSLKAPKYEIVQRGALFEMQKVHREYVHFKIWDNAIYTLIVQETRGRSFIYSNSVDIGTYMNDRQGHIKNNGYTVFQDNSHSTCQKVQESIKRLREAGYLVVLATKGKNMYIPTVRYLFNMDFNVVTGFASGSHKDKKGIWADEFMKETAFNKQEKDKHSSFRKSVAREERRILDQEKIQEKTIQQKKIADLEAECARLRKINSDQEEEPIDFDNEWIEPETSSEGYLDPPF